MVAALGLVAQLCVDVAGATGTAMAVAEIVEPRRGGPTHRERSMMLKGAESVSYGPGQPMGRRPYGQLPQTTLPFTIDSSRHAIDLLALRRMPDGASGRGESHPPALSEPDVSLSTHPAPIIQPHGMSPSRQ